MKRIKGLTPESLVEALAAIPNMERDRLLRRWAEFYKTAPPAHISTKLLRYAIAYKMQEQVYGGLKPAARRYLRHVVQDTAVGKAPTAISAVKPGTRLLREWHGKTYEVIVQSEGDGVLLNGEHVASLTEAAKRITGVKWSGPRFFGLVRGGRG